MSFSSISSGTWAQMALRSCSEVSPAGFAHGARSPALECTLASNPVICHCGASSAVTQQYTNPIVGGILHLPRVDDLPGWSVAKQQPKLNSRAKNHPCIVSMVSACGHLAYCMQITSFGGQGIEHKYQGCRNGAERERVFNGYMPLQEMNTNAINGKGMLSYYGDRMDRQSYANLEFGFWMELQHLQSKGSTFLDSDALARVKHHYAAAEEHRQVYGSEAERRFAGQRSSSPPSPPCSQGSSPSTSPTKASAPIADSWRRSLPSPPPSPARFVTPPRRNAAIAIKKSPSREKMEVMNGSWR